MKVAVYQAPLLKNGTMDAKPYIKAQIKRCEDEGVELLCCPEAVLGGLADYCNNPADVALDVESGQLEDVLLPFASDSVSLIIGFTESTKEGKLYNAAAVYHKGEVVGIYRKVYPAINQSVYEAGDQLPVFTVGALTFGIVICNDTNYIEPARVMAAKGTTAIFIPMNNGLSSHKADVVTLARNTQITRAVENGVFVMGADVAGECGAFVSYGSSAIVGPDGIVLAQSKRLEEDLLIADIETVVQTIRRGWDAGRNPAVVEIFCEQFYSESKKGSFRDGQV